MFVECTEHDFRGACEHAAHLRGTTIEFEEEEPFREGGFNLVAIFGDGDSAEYTAQPGHKAGTWAEALWS